MTVVVFGFLVVVAVVSAFVFRRRPLGTRLRSILSVVAVTMLGIALVRDNGFSPGALFLTLIAAGVLGYGIMILKRAEQDQPPRE